ncbi:UNVERIFIED_CONTAM: hypothetical protein Sradi_2655400 [Sesamum radiatum]|uniref:Reverse transcriptase zinc-binding domain-containing protein n=1 Tax=Sesamum radiatum TaxID=300843 RepID=A0AAW2S7N6_SESRA
MLAKQLWLIFCSPDRLLSQVLRARYFPHGDIFIATVGLTPPVTRLENLRVFDLIDHERGEWNSTLIQEVFLDIDSEVILEIPLSQLGADDLILWHYSPNGFFSVRSAYHLACSLEERPSASHLRETEHRWWRRLWQAALPIKVKVFTWRACLNALPTSRNLNRRLPGLCCVCPFCLEEGDDAMHFLALCSFARQFSNTTVSCPRARSLSWQGPPPNYVKLNFDGAILNHGTDTGLGIVTRDAWGTCVGWAVIHVPRRSSGELAEALAAREAVRLALRRGWQYVIIEGDCSSLISKLLSPSRDLSLMGPITVDILKLAKSALGFAEGVFDIPASMASFVALDAIVS